MSKKEVNSSVKRLMMGLGNYNTHSKPKMYKIEDRIQNSNKLVDSGQVQGGEQRRNQR